MILQEELVSLLIDISSNVPDIQERIQMDPSLLPEIAERIIMFNNGAYQLPSYEQFRAEPQAMDLFKKMLMDACQFYKNNDLLNKEKNERMKALMLELQSIIERARSSLMKQESVDPEPINMISNELLRFFGTSDFMRMRFSLDIKLRDLPLKNAELVTLDALNVIERAINFLMALDMPQRSYSLGTVFLNDLLIFSLKVHSKKCTAELASLNGPVHMIHFYSSMATEERIKNQAHSSEHLDSFDSGDERDDGISFDKTNHGLGSGVYGLANISEEEIKKFVKIRRDCFKVFEIRNPLRLYDDSILNESGAFTELSKYLQYACDSIKSGYSKEVRHLRSHGLYTGSIKQSAQRRALAVRHFFEDEINSDELCTHAENLLKFKNIRKLHLSVHEMYDLLLSSTIEFFVKAHPLHGHLTPMPINYVLRHLGFTGVVSTYNDRFNRGLIAIETPTTSPLLQVGIKQKLRPKSVSPFSSELMFFNGDSPQKMDIWDRSITPTQLSHMGSLQLNQTLFSPLGKYQMKGFQKVSPRNKRAVSLTELGETLFIKRESIDTVELSQLIESRIFRAHSLDSKVT